MAYTITVGEKPSKGFLLLVNLVRREALSKTSTDPGVPFWEKIFTKFSQKNS